MHRIVSKSKMEKVGIEILDDADNRIFLKCKKCGQAWSPCFLIGGRLPRGYWKCPRGCNETALQDYNKRLTAEQMIPYLPTATDRDEYIRMTKKVTG